MSVGLVLTKIIAKKYFVSMNYHANIRDCNYPLVVVFVEYCKRNTPLRVLCPIVRFITTRSFPRRACISLDDFRRKVARANL